MSQNHVIDPNFFIDAILLFAFDYEWYAKSSQELDEMGRVISKYDKRTINGSLQPSNSTIIFNKDGNTNSLDYDFYCRSLYRINLGDFIHYKNRFLIVKSIYEYDEYGVRRVGLTMINLVDYRDFAEYLKYLNGEIIV